jgi:hypothetical protein
MNTQRKLIILHECSSSTGEKKKNIKYGDEDDY